jgi:hypothetical protein
MTMAWARDGFDGGDCAAGRGLILVASLCGHAPPSPGKETFMLSWAVGSRIRWWPLGLLLSALVACATPASEPARREVARPVANPQRVATAESPPVIAPPARAAEPAFTVPVSPTAVAPAAPSAPYGPAVAARFPDPLVNFRTPAFQPGRTSFTSNAEVLALLRGLVRDGRPTGTTIELLSLGSSQAGVPLEALLFTRTTDTQPAAVLQAGRPTVLLIGQQHGDEPASSEALLAIAQDLARGRLEPLLERINVIVMPRANPDGASENRRVTASGIDVNRDHLLLKTPEAQALAMLARAYRPMVVLDAHEYTAVGRVLDKFGTVQRFDALLQYAMTANLPEFVSKASEEWFRRPLLARWKAEGLSSEWYYTTSADIADKKLSMGGVQPDTGRNVNGLKNAVSMLIETRGVGLGRLHFKRRVHTHIVAASSILQSTAERADDLMKLRAFVDNEVSSQACHGEAVIQAAATPSEYNLVMLDPQTGEDRTIPVAWDSALELRVLKTRPRPCGYWLSQSEADAVARLRLLGVLVQQIDELGEMRGEIYRETARELGQRADVRGSIADSGGVLKLQVQTVPALLDVPAGSYYVPLDQPLANLVIAALEPDTQNSYAANRIVSSVDGLARVMARPGVKMTAVP